MIKSGMSLPMAVFMSLVVYAGSAQLAVPSRCSWWVRPCGWCGSPPSCVNLRFVIFSSMGATTLRTCRCAGGWPPAISAAT